jgi:selenocysteine lyase/cysteine desulfurase
MRVAAAGVRSLDAAEADFRAAHPGYAATGVLDRLRASDYARLDAGGYVDLDYTGGGLYGSSQLRQHVEQLEAGVFGNSHSINPTSAASSALVDRARSYVLDFFGGAVRASLGLASNFADVYRFTEFAAQFVDLVTVLDDLPPRTAWRS